MNVLDVHHLLLDGLGEVDLHLLRGEARHHGDDADHRALDVGHHAPRHLEADGEDRQDHDPEVEGDHEVRVLDGPAADVALPAGRGRRVYMCSGSCYRSRHAPMTVIPLHTRGSGLPYGSPTISTAPERSGAAGSRKCTTNGWCPIVWKMAQICSGTWTM